MAIIYLPDPGSEGSIIIGAHNREACSGNCALHSPSDHWARDMPLVWEYDPTAQHGSMMRRCPHGDLHSDPDDLAYRLKRGLGVLHPGPSSLECDCPCRCLSIGHVPVPF